MGFKEQTGVGRNEVEGTGTLDDRITIIGNHAWDHYWVPDLRQSLSREYEVGPDGRKRKVNQLSDIISLEANSIVFRERFRIKVKFLNHGDGPDLYIEPKDERIFFGQKRASSSTWKDMGGVSIEAHLDNVHPGGGAFNLAEAFSGFNNAPARYVGPCHKDGEPDFEKALEKIGLRNHVLYPYLREYQPNLIIQEIIDQEGKKLQINRIIIKGFDFDGAFQKGEFGSSRQYLGKTVVIDSLKDVYLGLDILNSFDKARQLGIIAMTVSTPWQIKARAVQEGLVPIFSDDDFEHYYQCAQVCIRKKDGGIDYSELMRALKLFREEQSKVEKTRVYVTLGKEGSLCLDEKDMIHRVGVYKPSSEKDTNGAGDAFASGIVALEHMQRHISGNSFDPIAILQLSAAVASSKISDGAVRAGSVDEYLKGAEIFRGQVKSLDYYGDDPNALSLKNLHEKIGKTSLKTLFGEYGRSRR